MEDLKYKLSSYLFWDMDFDEINTEKNAAHIIEKVITRGQLEDWFLIKEYYGLERIKNVALRLRYLDDKTLNFASRLFTIPKQEFRCYTMRQSHPGPWKS